jgi:CRP-like cAMP-binding protein
MESLSNVFLEHPLFSDLDRKYVDLLVECASLQRFEEGKLIFKEGGPADTFFIIRYGRVAVEMYVPHKGPTTIETLGEGGVLGWGWLFPPYKWHFDARALELTRTIAVDGRCFLSKIEDDPKLGYIFMKKFNEIIQTRLQSTRLRLIDMYGLNV